MPDPTPCDAIDATSRGKPIVPDAVRSDPRFGPREVPRRTMPVPEQPGLRGRRPAHRVAGPAIMIMMVTWGALMAAEVSSPGAGPDADEAVGPRYRTTRSPSKTRSGAIVRDAFEEAGVDESVWRIWTSNPEAVEHKVSGGRYWISIRGEAGYNGLVSRNNVESRDIVAVCRTGIESAPGAHHASIVHLCGSGDDSPDHWYEILLREWPDGLGAATSAVAVPRDLKAGYIGTYRLPFPAVDGYLVRIECAAEAHLCTGQVRVGDEWWQIGDSFEVPARRARLEVKAAGNALTEGTSRIWFDDCRMYPRPRTHYVTVVVRDPDGGMPGTAGAKPWQRVCRDPAGEPIPGCGFTVDLLTADGSTLVDTTDTGRGFGYALLSLEKAPWDLYPQEAIIRVSANGRPIGPDHLIARDGVEGLYPDDTFVVTLE